MKYILCQAGIWKQAKENFPEIPSAEYHGWMKRDGLLEPLWCEGNLFPKQLANLLDEEDQSDVEDNELIEANETDSECSDSEI